MGLVFIYPLKVAISVITAWFILIGLDQFKIYFCENCCAFADK